MGHPILRLTTANIIRLWFGADTPIRRYKIRMNPRLWTVCNQVAAEFTPPSGAPSPDRYRKADRVRFAQVVQQRVETNVPDASPA
ncbi:hypothetical protein ACAW74_17950 [Fibrella sp. WM1]|uniref:hypothetical protein n=1 Tax=Fibrella musci TaxID=3242485 RepID=UPI003520E0F5